MHEREMVRGGGRILQYRGSDPDGCVNLSTSVAYTTTGSTPSFCLAG